MSGYLELLEELYVDDFRFRLGVIPSAHLFDVVRESRVGDAQNLARKSTHKVHRLSVDRCETRDGNRRRLVNTLPVLNLIKDYT